MNQTLRWARPHLRRYIAMAFNYVTERAVLLGALMVPAIAGATDADLGRLELLLTAAALAAAIGPLGTQHALMYKSFRGTRSSWRMALSTSIVGGFLVGGLAALTLGPGYAFVGGLLGMFIAVHRVAAYRLRADDSTGPLTWSSVIFVAAFAIGSTIAATASVVATAILPALMGAALLATIPAFWRATADDSKASRSYLAMLRYGLPLSLAALSDWVVVAGDRYVIQLFLGLDGVGPYGVIYRTVMLLSGAVSTLVVWWQAEALRRGFAWAREQVGRFLTLTVGTTIVLAIVTLVPVSMFLDAITDLGFADVFAITAWLMVSIAGFVALMGLVHVFASAGWVRQVGLLSMANASINIVGNFALLPHFGLVGAAAATAISQCTTASLAMLVYRRRRRLDL